MQLFFLIAAIKSAW